MNICLLNDSFPPVIDGVVNVVLNYGEYLVRDHQANVVVGTPRYPEADYGQYPYQVVAYPSFDTENLASGYRAGNPFGGEALEALASFQPEIIHSHCPASSTVIARLLREKTGAPVVFTYHTKYDIDIRRVVHLQLAAKEAITAMVNNIEACDEVWTVSRGAGESLKALGFQGDYRVMGNGVDFPRGRAEQDLVARVTADWDLPGDVPVFLFVGRMMTYKGLPLILEALKLLSDRGADFRMVFIGKGPDKEALERQARTLGLMDAGGPDRCLFIGPVYDREALRAWNTRADLFLFPSTFDTNGLVVREAAACALPSLLVRGSCAAEDSTDGEDGFLIEENADSMAACLRRLLDAPERIRAAGERAQKNLYLSWEDAVANACEGYRTVIDNYRAGRYPAHKGVSDEVLHRLARLMDWAERLDPQRQPPDPAERSLPFGELASVLRKVREARDGGQRPDRFL